MGVRGVLRAVELYVAVWCSLRAGDGEDPIEGWSKAQHREFRICQSRRNRKVTAFQGAGAMMRSGADIGPC